MKSTVLFSPRGGDDENRHLNHRRQRSAQVDDTSAAVPELLLIVRNGALWPPLLLASEQQQLAREQLQRDEEDERARQRELDRLREAERVVENFADAVARRNQKQKQQQQQISLTSSSPKTPPRGDCEAVQHGQHPILLLQEQDQALYASPTPLARDDPPPRPSNVIDSSAVEACRRADQHHPQQLPPKKVAESKFSPGGTSRSSANEQLASDLDAALTPKSGTGVGVMGKKRVSIVETPRENAVVKDENNNSNNSHVMRDPDHHSRGPSPTNSAAAVVGAIATPPPNRNSPAPGTKVPPPPPSRPEVKQLYQPHEQGSAKDVHEDGNLVEELPVMQVVDPKGNNKSNKKQDDGADKKKKPKSFLEYLCGCCVSSGS